MMKPPNYVYIKTLSRLLNHVIPDSPSNQVKSYLQFQQVHNSKSSTLFYWKTLIKTKGITLVPGAPKVIFHQIPRPEDKYRNDSRHVLCLIIWYAWQKLSSRALEVDKRICGQG